MLLILSFFALLASFYFLAVVCDLYFVPALDKIAEKTKMNSDMAGATLMAVGSSAPELFVSLIALGKVGSESMGAGTIVGSAIFNVLVIIGASAIVRKAWVAWQPVIRDLIFYSLSIIMLIFSFRDGIITLTEALLFILLYIVYVIAVMKWRKILPYKEESKDIVEDLEKGLEKEEKKKNSFLRFLKLINQGLDKIFPSLKHYWLLFFSSILAIAGLSWVLVESGVIIANGLGIPPAIVGLTILAAGTSIPDLISSVIVAKQGRGGMAISNALGSNIFDILICLGLPWTIVLLSGKKVTVATENLNSSIFLLFATVLAVFVFLQAKKWRIGKRAGYGLLGLYVAYLLWNIWQVL